MKKLSGFRFAAVAAFVFGVAVSFGASAFGFPPSVEQNAQCVACHQGCDDARQACIASGQGGCFPAFRVCTETCSRTYANCAIP